MPINMDISPVSGRKLKQAQLPFTVIRKQNAVLSHSPVSSKSGKNSHKGGSSSEDTEDKENISSRNRCITKNTHEKKLESSNVAPMIVDLTAENSCPADSFTTEDSGSSIMPSSTLHNIEEAINSVVRRCSTEFTTAGEGILTPKGSAKKRRRRSKSLSPVPPEAKKAILCDDENITSSGEAISQEFQSGENAERCIPQIIVTTATPVGRQKSASVRKTGEVLCEKAQLPSRKTAEPKQPQHEKHAPKYPPLSSVLGKKRQRSKSPTAFKDVKAAAAKIKEEKQTEIDLADLASKKSKQMPNQDIPETPPIKLESSLSLAEEESKRIGEECSSPPTSSKSLGPSKKDSPSPPPKSIAVTPMSAAKMQRSLEAQRKKDEKEKEKEEKRKQREEQRLAKEKEKLELKRKKDEEKAQKEEERRKKREEEEAAKMERQKKQEDKRREKEKQELEKKAEKERKEEERRKEKERKEEEKRQKELEKQKAEEEKKQAVEEKRRKSEKRAETFKSFFKSPARSPTVKKTADNVGIFVAFQPKQDMLLAPMHRSTITPTQKQLLDVAIKGQSFDSSYLKEGKHLLKFANVSPTMPKLKKRLVSLAEDGLELVENGETKPGVKVLRAKFLSFHTNYRPAYYGTWRKESKALSYKNPFKKDESLFDYEFDSDDEWEEPAEGEDIANSDGEDEGDTNEEDEDDGFFVPHGYLSDDEGINEEGEEDGLKPDHKLKQKQLEFEASFKRKLSALTPIVIGCIWRDSAASLDKVHREILDRYKPEILCKTPIEIYPAKTNAENETDSPADGTKPDSSKKAHGLKAVPEEAMPDLIRLLHGNALSLARIVNEFRVYWKIKKGSDEPISCGPGQLDEPSTETEMEQMDVGTEDAPSAPCELDSAPPSGRTSPTDDASTKTVISTPKSSYSDFEISKTQLYKKCKEIATYTKRDNINRSCWFVHEAVLESYELGENEAPVPCRWNYATEVPKIQILIFPQTKPAATSESLTATPSPSPGPGIAKFVAKLSPKVILEQSKLKHEKAKQAIQMNGTPNQALSISKYTTEKISPIVIIEKSAQKIAEDMAKIVQTQETSKLNQNATLAQSQESTYVIPTPEAMKSLFRMDSKENSATPSPHDAPKNGEA